MIFSDCLPVILLMNLIIFIIIIESIFDVFLKF